MEIAQGKRTMKLDSVDYRMVKDCSRSLDLDSVNYLSGATGSGKSACVEAVRLALTGRCSVGSSPAKIASMFTDKGGSARVAGDGVFGEFTLTCSGGKNSIKKKVTLTGIETNGDAIMGGIPVVAGDLWAMTGEDKWKLLESIVGEFREKPPESTDAIRRQIDQLSAEPELEPYTGPGVPQLKSELEKVRQKISEEKSKRRAKPKLDLETMEKDVDQYHGILDAAIKQRDKLQGKSEEFSKVLQSLREAEANEYALTSARDGIKHLCSQSLKLISTLVPSGPPIVGVTKSLKAKILDVKQLLEDIQKEASEGDEDMPLESVADDLAKQAVEILDSLGFEYDLIKINSQTLEKAFTDKVASVSRSIGGAQQAISRAEKRRQEARDAEQQAAPISEEEFAALITQEKELAAQLHAAEAWTAWVKRREENGKRVGELREKLSKLDDEHKAYQKRRAEYLEGALTEIQSKCNDLCTIACVFPVSVSAEATGKRPSLCVGCNGVPLEAMSGGEKVLYSNILLSSLQMLSDAPCPLLVVEAAEMDAPCTKKLTVGLMESRTKGNVLIARHSEPPDIEGLKVIKF